MTRRWYTAAVLGLRNLPESKRLRLTAGPAAERATHARLVEDFAGSSLLRTFELSGIAWLIAAVAAGVAVFRRADARSSVAVVLLLLLSAVPISWHVPPFRPVGLALFITAVS